jgi:DNA-binding NtrC family response regulator
MPTPSPVRLIGDSPALQRVRNRIDTIAPTPLPVLVRGETGTGKEVVARLLHERSGRKGPFVPVDCGSLSQSLVETELFGYERGAFTGANQRREGLVYAADGGTFFLDEIGELPLETQTRLLRLLENGTYRPVGSQEQRSADIRVVAATWRDLQARVAEGAFRQDLYHRLSIVDLVLPPLRDRPEDIPELFEYFVEAAQDTRADARPRTLRLEASTRAHLERWPWPGNVRELRNAAQYVAAMAPGTRVRIEDLPPQLLRSPPAVPDQGTRLTETAYAGSPVRTDLPYMEARRLFLDDFQQRYVEAQLAEHDGNVSAAARAAGMDRRSIQRILARARQSGAAADDS